MTSISNLDNLFDIQDLTQTEMDIVALKLSDPVVKKYLVRLARLDIQELATLSLNNLSDSELSKKHSLIEGKLSAYLTLTSIQT